MEELLQDLVLLVSTFQILHLLHQVKHGLDVGAGVIDADYRGPVGVVMFNLSDTDFKGTYSHFTNLLIFKVVKGDRIAQLIIEKIEMCECVQVEELDSSARGAKGFGSSGMQ